MRVKYLPVAEGRSVGISDFPNFHASGSVAGMKKQFYRKDALLVHCGSYIYHVGNLNDHSGGPVLQRGQTIYFARAH